MDKQLRSQVVFHLTGRHAQGADAAAAVAGMRPALMAAHRRLDELRYDFPVVFTAAGDAFVQSLSSIVETALRTVAPAGVAGEALRRRGLRVEREIRRRVAHGETGTFGQLWERAVAAVAPAGDAAFLRDAGEIRKAIEAHDFSGIGRVTASFGVAVCRSDDSVASLMARADGAAYRAKAGGRNRVESGDEPG